MAVPARAASPAGGGGGGGFPPNAPVNVPPPTPAVSPRPTKKRFNGDDALAPRDVKEKRDEGMRLSKALARPRGVSPGRGDHLRRSRDRTAAAEQPQHAVSPSRDVIAVDGRAPSTAASPRTAHRYFALSSEAPRNKLGKATTGIGENKLVLDLFGDHRAAWRKKHPGKLPAAALHRRAARREHDRCCWSRRTGSGASASRTPARRSPRATLMASTPTKAQVKRMAEGCVVDGKKVTPRRVESLENAKDGARATACSWTWWTGATARCASAAAAAGVGVKKLKRVRVGGLRMPGELPLGKYMTLKRPHQVAYVLDQRARQQRARGRRDGRGMGKSFD